MSYLKNISRLSGTGNMGGILDIRVVRAADVESIPAPVNGVVYGDIVLKPGRSFVNWRVTDESANAESQSRTSREGSSRQNRIPFSVPKDRADLLDMFERASHDELIVLYRDANGKQKIFGLPQAPVQFEYSHGTGSARSNKNAFSCSFYYSGPQNMFEYNGLLPSPLPGVAPAIVRYNGVAIASLQPGETLNIISDFGFTDFYVTA